MGHSTFITPMKNTLHIILLIGLLFAVSNKALALTVSPAKIEITADPGQTVGGEIELFNEQDSEKIFYTSYENFEPRGDSGAPYFVGAKDGLATWIKTDASVTLKSGERVIVPYSITVPNGTDPGGYFAAIFFGSQPPKAEGGGEVSIGGKIGILVLLRVSGEVAEGGGLLDFFVKENSRVASSLPVTFEYRLNNIGGNRVVPLGEIKVKNTFRFTSATLLANENQGSVLPGSTRKFSVVWGKDLMKANEGKSNPGFFKTALDQLKNFHFGWYTAKLNLSWGETNQTADASYNFFIMPWQLLSILALIILVLGFIGRAGLRKYNRFIIGQAMRQQQNE